MSITRRLSVAPARALVLTTAAAAAWAAVGCASCEHSDSATDLSSASPAKAASAPAASASEMRNVPPPGHSACLPALNCGCALTCVEARCTADPASTTRASCALSDEELRRATARLQTKPKTIRAPETPIPVLHHEGAPYLELVNHCWGTCDVSKQDLRCVADAGACRPAG